MELLVWFGLLSVFIIATVVVIFLSSNTRKARSKSDDAAVPLLGVVTPNLNPGSWGKEEN